jgi:hypothetical protein
MDKDTSEWTLFTILIVRSDLDIHFCDSTDGPTKQIKSIHKMLLQALSKAGVQVRNQTSLLGMHCYDATTFGLPRLSLPTAEVFTRN